MKDRVHERIGLILDRMHEVYLGQDRELRCLLAALLAGGHVLLEGVPGVGKTLMALTLARLFDLSFKRIQFTNDMLPSDVIGFHALRQESGTWELIKGPVFANLVLADEINRTSPKTQSALLEAMEEGQVTIDGITYSLPEPFMVIATQNPLEIAGTFPLPESQLDRFLLKLSIGYPPANEETEILRKDIDHKNALRLRPVMDSGELARLAAEASQVFVHEDVLGYILRIVSGTRVHPDIELGVSPRGGLALKRICQAWAFIHGRDFVTPGDVAALAPFVLEHRIISKNGTPQGLIERVIHGVEIPL